jgi:translocation and assembly module TamB
LTATDAPRPPDPPGPPAPRGAGPGRFRRVLGGALAAMGLTAVFAGALVASLVLHLDFAVTRRTVRFFGNDLFLGTAFKGKLVLGEVDRLTLLHGGLAVRSAVAYDPRGVQAARLDGLRVDISGLLKGVLFGKNEMRVAAPLVHVDHADLLLERGPAGGLTIAEVFAPRVPSPPPPPGGAPFHLALERIEIDHIWVHGEVAPPTVLDTEVQGLVASVAVDPDGVTINAQKLHIDARAPLPLPLTATTSLHMKLAEVMEIAGAIDGKVGDIDLHVEGKLDGQHVTARVDVPHATPAAIAAFLPKGTTLPLHATLSETLEVEGDLPDLKVKSRLAVDGGGDITVDGKVHAAAPVHIEADAVVAKVDPRVALDLPSATPINAKAHGELDAGGALKIKATATTEPFQLGPNLVPGVDAEAKLEDGVWTATAHVHETGAPATASVTFDKEGLRFEASVDVPSIHAYPRVKLPVTGAAQVQVAGVFRDGVLDAKVRGRYSGVTAPGGVSVDGGTIEGHVTGPVDALEVDAAVAARGVRASDYAWQTVRVTARGPVMAPRVDALLDEGNGQTVHASADVDPKAGAAYGIHLNVKRKDGEIDGGVQRVSWSGGGVVVAGLTLGGDGVGKIAGGLTVRDKEIVGRLRGTDVDLGKVAAIAGLRAQVGGLANVDIDLASSHAGSRTGHVAIELQDGKAPKIDGVSALFTATFDGDKVKADGLLRLIARAAPGGDADKDDDERCDGAIAQVVVTGGEGQTAGPLLDPATWEKLSGRLHFAADDWNLHCVSRLAPIGVLLSDIRGKLTTRATIERRPGAPLPTVRGFLVKTHGLQVAGAKPLLGGAPAWESRSMDVEVRGSLDTATGVATTAVTLFDGGKMLGTDVSATLDLPAILGTPEQRLASLRKAPLSGHISIPRRAVKSFKTLPSFIAQQIPPVQGDVQLDASLEGTIEQPYVKVKAQGWDLAYYAPGSLRPVALPVSFAVATTYDGHALALDAHVQHTEQHKEHEVLAANGKLEIELADIFAKKKPQPRGGLTVKLTDLPFNELPALTDRDISGHLGGTIAVTGLGEKPSVLVDLSSPDLKIGQDLAYDHAAVRVDLPAPTGAASKGLASAPLTAKIDLASKTGGSLTAGASATVQWEDGLVPSPDMSRPASGSLVADHFRIAALTPFLTGVLSRLDGRLDGRATAELARLAEPENAKLAVSLDLTGGVLNVDKLGQELHDVGVSIKSQPDGSIAIRDLRARGTKGALEGSGSVRLAGVRFVGASAAIGIKPGEALPVMLDGVPYGDLNGTITVEAKRAGSDTTVDVNIPKLHLELPSAVGRGVQSLDDNPDITIAQAAPKEKEPAPAGPSRLAITFHIGEIDIAGKHILGQIESLNLGLTGSKQAPLEVTIADGTKLTGVIKLPRGKIELMKKSFEIERGEITMNPKDAGNPYIDVTAKWESPDGTIYLDYVGSLLPATMEKIHCRSQTLAADQCLKTVLFGSADISTGAGAQALGMQVLAQQFSTQISDNCSTDLGTTDDGSVRPGVKCTLGKFEIEGSTYDGAPPGQPSNSSVAKTQRILGTVDWPFWHNWRLRLNVDAGSEESVTGVDVLWQYHY